MASLSVYLKSLCDNTSFISRSNQAALSRKVTMEERKECSHREIHFPSVRSHSLSLSRTFREICPSRSRLRLGCYIRTAIFPPCAPPPRSGVFFDLSRGRQVCRRHYSLSSPTVVLLCRAFFHNDPSSHYPSPSVFHFYFYYYNLLLLLLLLRRRSLLLISLVSTSQGPFSRRSLFLTEHALHAAFVSVNHLYIDHYELS